MTDWKAQTDLIAKGERFEVYSNDLHGFWMKRLADGATAEWTGDDSCESFRNVFEEHGGDEFAEEEDEIRTNGEAADETGEHFSDLFTIPAVPSGPYMAGPCAATQGGRYVVTGASGAILCSTFANTETDRLCAVRIAAALNAWDESQEFEKEPEEGTPEWHFEKYAKDNGYRKDRDGCGETVWAKGGYNPDSYDTLYGSAKEVCETYFPKEDWRHEVAKEETNLGYDEWLWHQVEDANA